jgi:hypothetical protein
MSKKMLAILIILASVLIIRAFFMPWVTVDTTLIKAAGEMAADPKGKIVKAEGLRITLFKNIGSIFYPAFRRIDKDIEVVASGYTIPKLMHGQKARFIVPFMEALFKDIDNINNKSFLVYGLPIGAIACILFALLGLRFRVPVILMLMLSEATSIIGMYNLISAVDTDLKSAFADLTIEPGMWYSLGGFFFIFIMSFLWLAFLKE